MREVVWLLLLFPCLVQGQLEPSTSTAATAIESPSAPPKEKCSESYAWDEHVYGCVPCSICISYPQSPFCYACPEFIYNQATPLAPATPQVPTAMPDSEVDLETSDGIVGGHRRELILIITAVVTFVLVFVLVLAVAIPIFVRFRVNKRKKGIAFNHEGTCLATPAVSTVLGLVSRKWQLRREKMRLSECSPKDQFRVNIPTLRPKVTDETPSQGQPYLYSKLSTNDDSTNNTITMMPSRSASKESGVGTSDTGFQQYVRDHFGGSVPSDELNDSSAGSVPSLDSHNSCDSVGQGLVGNSTARDNDGPENSDDQESTKVMVVMIPEAERLLDGCCETV